MAKSTAEIMAGVIGRQQSPQPERTRQRCPECQQEAAGAGHCRALGQPGK